MMNLMGMLKEYVLRKHEDYVHLLKIYGGVLDIIAGLGYISNDMKHYN